MLVVYRTRMLRITPKFTRWVIGTIVGTLVLTLANVVALALGGDLGPHDGGTVSVVAGVALIALAFAEPTAQLRRRRPDASTRRGRDVVLIPRVRPGRHPRMALRRHRLAHFQLPLTTGHAGPSRCFGPGVRTRQTRSMTRGRQRPATRCVGDPDEMVRLAASAETAERAPTGGGGCPRGAGAA